MFIPPGELFLSTVADLRDRLDNPTDYDLVRAAGLCRQLLLDRRPFLNMIERLYDYKTRFRVIDFDGNVFYGAGLTMVWVSIAPNKVIGKSKDVQLREFLHTKLLRLDSYLYTVTQIIRAASHCMGGIHSFEPEDEIEQALNDLERGGVVGPDAHKTTHYAIKSVCQVVLKAIEPLEAKIKGITPP